MTNGWPSRSDSHGPIRRARMSLEPAGGNGTIMRTGRVGYACAQAKRDTPGSAAAHVARWRKFRRGRFSMFFPEILKTASPDLFSLDVRGLKDRPPFFDLGLLLRGKPFGRLLLAQRNVLALISEPLPHGRVSQGGLSR